MSSPLPSDEQPFHRIRRSNHNSSPPVKSEFEIRYDIRNTEAVHKEGLANAYLLHESVRENALRVLEIEARKHLIEVRQAKLDAEAERIRVAHLEAEQKIQAAELLNKKKAIPKTPPRTKTPPPPATTIAPVTSKSTSIITPQVIGTAPQLTPTTSTLAPTSNTPETPFQGLQPAVPITQHTPGNVQLVGQPTTPGLQTPRAPEPVIQEITKSITTQPIVRPAPPSTTQPPSQTAITPPAPTTVKVETTWTSPVNGHPHHSLYLRIHQALKQNRKLVDGPQASPNPEFKKIIGGFRRTIRTSVGQLVFAGDTRGNVEKTAKILAILRQALTPGSSVNVDPSQFVAANRPPLEGGQQNGPLPAGFIYLLNHFAKAIISQLIDESAVRPASAGPIARIAISVFTNPSLLWRGSSLFDILMAKFRVVCPVLFGISGNEKTTAGRISLGWQQRNGNFVQEQTHILRMSGLATGYAAICLIKYTVREPAWPPAYYWMTIANILSTPDELISATQCVVLQGMLQMSIGTFLEFYGNAAIAALQVAIVRFPQRVREPSAASRSLAVLAVTAKMDHNLDLLGPDQM